MYYSMVLVDVLSFLCLDQVSISRDGGKCYKWVILQPIMMEMV